jgi:hypothetical protein
LKKKELKDANTELQKNARQQIQLRQQRLPPTIATIATTATAIAIAIIAITT